LRPLEQLIGIVASLINCKDELAVFVSSSARLFDLNGSNPHQRSGVDEGRACRVQVEPVGEFELKGIRRPMAAYNVVAAVN
jgi:hypothetical protein